MSGVYPQKAPSDVETARKLLDAAGFAHWFIVAAPGYGQDENLIRAERTAGGRVEVTHSRPETLVELVRETEARLPVAKPVAVAEGEVNSQSYR